MNFIYKTDKKEYPMVPVRGLWAFPDTVVHFDCQRSVSKKAVEDALLNESEIFLVNQKDILEDNPKKEDIYDYGTVAKIKQTFNLQNGELRVLIEAKCVGEVLDVKIEDGFFKAQVKEYIFDEENFESNENIEALKKMLIEDFRSYVSIDNSIPPEIAFSLVEIDNIDKLANLITYYLPLSPKENYSILKELDIEEKLVNIHKLIQKEIELKDLSKKIDAKVQENINKGQKEYYLREKLNAVKDELNDLTGKDLNEADAFRKKIKKLKINKEDKQSLLKSVDRLEMIPEMSPDYGVITSYLDFVLGLPWSKKSKDNLDIIHAKKVLDQDHYGLMEVKERILESIAVRKKKGNNQAAVICLSGPPGVGKTSIAKSIARALNREFISMRLGGVSDESEIRGHRRTYVGAMAGRILSNISRIKVKNPVFLLDEIDKLGSDFRGDPSSALLEVLDPEQNDKFIDRYLDIGFDLSEVFFITTANDISNIPPALFDRLEIIQISGYTQREKEEIAKRYLIKKEMETNGLDDNDLKISDPVIEKIIKSYTREAGVRSLERNIAKICRRAVKEILEGKKKVNVTMRNYEKYLGKERFFDDQRLKEDKIGIANGLAWTQVGGTILNIEVNVMDGKGANLFTGSLGDVMKESAQAAISYLRKHARDLDIDPDFYKNKDIHVHVPEGATPKDGPSAGITMTTAIASALTGKKVRSDLAMTGEVTITGEVLPIGGLKEKALAAYSYDIKNVIIPKENERDIEDIDKEIRDKINFIKVSYVGEVLKEALI
ncbi:endopeptidase La [Anaerococcus hydrogenalis]|uniref:endopeptidase La n=1 Tax=Anaerococcus hydrogenalis TaxID=33029 RepID=UPI0028FF4C7E|nr:endopeptidase La [Anaerococcus hydrogenalis]MDU1315626.1 endopeptidase La [Anaerococcus hydrogenalis]